MSKFKGVLIVKHLQFKLLYKITNKIQTPKLLMIENTSLPNSIIRTVSELFICALEDSSPLAKKATEFMKTPKLGFWLIELSSISGRRKEVGNSSAIVRLICFFKKDDQDIIYCTETIEGELLIWENCRFYCLLPHDFDWVSQSETIAANLDWARGAIERHELNANLKSGEKLFFDIAEK